MHTTALLVVLGLHLAQASGGHAELATDAADIGVTTNQAVYSTNNICFAKFCTNPIFPGMEQFGQSVLAINEDRTWQCTSSTHNLWRLAGICGRVVAGYHFALPDARDARAADPDGSPEEGEGRMASEEDLILAQSRQALTTYVAHLTGMGHDFWEFSEPWLHDECIQAVWKMSCYTHFPQCNRLEEGKYLRPCRSSCETYLRSCKVQCCDEGVRCVFNHKRELPDGSVVTEQGYVDHSGPSPLCTGGAASALGRPLGALLLPVLLFAAAPFG